MRGRFILLLSLICSTASGSPPPVQVIAHDDTHLLSDNYSGANKKDRLLGADKLHHVLSSAFIAALTYHYAREGASWSHDKAITFGIGVTLSIGVSKEVFDRYSGKGEASIADVLADAFGTAIGLLIFSGS